MYDYIRSKITSASVRRSTGYASEWDVTIEGKPKVYLFYSTLCGEGLPSSFNPCDITGRMSHIGCADVTYMENYPRPFSINGSLVPPSWEETRRERLYAFWSNPTNYNVLAQEYSCGYDKAIIKWIVNVMVENGALPSTPQLRKVDGKGNRRTYVVEPGDVIINFELGRPPHVAHHLISGKTVTGERELIGVDINIVRKSQGVTQVIL